jgi:hypothetical protein
MDVEKRRHRIFYNIIATDWSQGENLCLSIFKAAPL